MADDDSDDPALVELRRQIAALLALILKTEMEKAT